MITADRARANPLALTLVTLLGLVLASSGGFFVWTYLEQGQVRRAVWEAITLALGLAFLYSALVKQRLPFRFTTEQRAVANMNSARPHSLALTLLAAVGLILTCSGAYVVWNFLAQGHIKGVFGES